MTIPGRKVWHMGAGAAVLAAFLLATPISAEDRARMPRSLAVDSARQAVWVATEDGLWSFTGSDGSLTRFGVEEGLPSARVNAVALDVRGEPWVGTDSGVAWREGKSWRVASEGLPSPIVLSIAKTRAGALYAGTDRGIARFDGRRGTFSALRDSHEFCRDPVLAIAEERAGDGIWFARERAFERLGTDGSFRIYQKDFLNPDRSCPLLGRHPRTIALSPSGAVWMATEGGINILDPAVEVGRARWDEIPFLSGPVPPSPLPSAEVRSMAFDSKGIAWLAFGDAAMGQGGCGVLRLGTDGSSARYGKTDGLPSQRVHALAVGGDGTVWAATPAGLASFRNGVWKSFPWPGAR